MSREAANQSDDQQPITNNETQVDNQVATEVEQEKATSPKLLLWMTGLLLTLILKYQ